MVGNIQSPKNPSPCRAFGQNQKRIWKVATLRRPFSLPRPSWTISMSLLLLLILPIPSLQPVPGCQCRNRTATLPPINTMANNQEDEPKSKNEMPGYWGMMTNHRRHRPISFERVPMALERKKIAMHDCWDMMTTPILRLLRGLAAINLLMTLMGVMTWRTMRVTVVECCEIKVTCHFDNLLLAIIQDCNPNPFRKFQSRLT